MAEPKATQFLSRRKRTRADATRIVAALALQRAHDLGIGGIKAGLMDKGFVNPHTVCLPVDTPRERALKLQSGKNFVPWGQPK